MNILFLLGQFPSIGGVETVSTVLANNLSKLGHNVHVASFEQKIDRPSPPLSQSVECHQFSYPTLSVSNICKLHELLKKHNIDFIINQWCLPYHVTLLCRASMFHTNCKLIAVHHNTPDNNARIEYYRLKLLASTSWYRKAICVLLLKLCRIITGLSLRMVYNSSHAYVVLSDSFHEVFQKITGLSKTPKLHTITNPLTIDESGECSNKKNNEILYVGRLEHNQKRVSRALEVWHLLEKDFPDWKLRIVGDGPERQSLENMIVKYALKRVSLEGFRSPEPYYRTASILVLTSEYEGFPLVLPEAMSMGVVPVVYASYSAAYDLIDNGTNGFLISAKDGFSAKTMARCLRNLMTEQSRLQEVSQNAKQKAKCFMLSTITNLWMNLFEKLKNER